MYDEGIQQEDAVSVSAVERFDVALRLSPREKNTDGFGRCGRENVRVGQED